LTAFVWRVNKCGAALWVLPRMHTVLYLCICKNRCSSSITGERMALGT